MSTLTSPLTVSAPVPSAPIPFPVPAHFLEQEPEFDVVPVRTDPQWAGPRCHTVLPTSARRFRVR